VLLKVKLLILISYHKLLQTQLWICLCINKKPIGNGIITCLEYEAGQSEKKKGAEAAKAVNSVLSQK
jgi:6,7-dimethyl-8-ribityllumazine synthase